MVNIVRCLFLITFFTLFTHPKDKVLILTCAFNRPDFIELQYKTFKAFLNDDYEFVVFNDANTRATYLKIHELCKKCKIRCIDLPQDIQRKRNGRPVGHMTRNGVPIYIDINRKSPSCFAADALQYTLDSLGFDHQGIVLYIDADIFLIKEFSVTEYLKGYDLAGHPQSRDHVEYLWNGIIFMNMQTLPNKHTMNFDCGLVDGKNVDTGGQIHCYLKENPSLHLRYYNGGRISLLPQTPEQLHDLGYDTITTNFILSNPSLMELYVDSHFLHYTTASNWNHKPATFHQQKTNLLVNFIDTLLTQHRS